MHRTVVLLLYGSGLPMLEALRLGLNDVAFAAFELTVREGKGDKGPRTMLPGATVDDLRHQIESTQRYHHADLAKGVDGVELPRALARHAGNNSGISTDPRTGVRRRHHFHESSVPKAIHGAAGRSKIRKLVTAHTFRDSIVTHLLQSGYDIGPEQELLGPSDVQTPIV